MIKNSLAVGGIQGLFAFMITLSVCVGYSFSAHAQEVNKPPAFKYQEPDMNPIVTQDQVLGLRAEIQILDKRLTDCEHEIVDFESRAIMVPKGQHVPTQKESDEWWRLHRNDIYFVPTTATGSNGKEQK